MRVTLLLISMLSVFAYECEIDILEEADKSIVENYMARDRPFLLKNQLKMSVELFNQTYHDYDVMHGNRDVLQFGHGGDLPAKVKDMYDLDTQTFEYYRDLDELRPEIIPYHPYQIISVGGSQSGVGFHRHMRAFFSLLHGAKEWYFFSAEKETMYEFNRTKKFLRDDVSHQWFEQPIFCVQEAGSIMFVPNHWPHATINLKTAIGIGYQLEEKSRD